MKWSTGSTHLLSSSSSLWPPVTLKEQVTWQSKAHQPPSNTTSYAVSPWRWWFTTALLGVWETLIMYRWINAKWLSRATWIIASIMLTLKYHDVYMCLELSIAMLFLCCHVILFLLRWVMLEVRAFCLHLWDEKVKALYSAHSWEAWLMGGGAIKGSKRERKLLGLYLPRSEMDIGIEMFIQERSQERWYLSSTLERFGTGFPNVLLTYLFKETGETMFLLVLQRSKLRRKRFILVLNNGKACYFWHISIGILKQDCYIIFKCIQWNLNVIMHLSSIFKNTWTSFL